ncbi:MAG: hypothetical protein KFF46_08990, partial [Desulfobacterales bacterium]|nr:hypothetical protein [Desulfobacterales bacterium]
MQQNVDRLLWPLIIYLMCFFVPISGNLHRNIFYIAVLLPFVVAIKKGFVSELFRSRIVVLTVLLAFYLTARNFFYVQGDFTEAFDYLRYFFSFVCFFVICVALFQHASLTRQIHRVAT